MTDSAKQTGVVREIIGMFENRAGVIFDLVKVVNF